LLSEAGWRDHDGDGILDKGSVPFRFGLMIPASSPEAAKMATKLKEDFGRAGIDLRLQRVEWSIFVRRLRTHDFDACTLAWADSGPRGDPTQIWHSSSREGGSNYVGFDNREADLLMDEARGTLDDERRDALYRRLGALLHRTAVHLALRAAAAHAPAPERAWGVHLARWLAAGGVVGR